ncbi:MAG: penicillin-binding protein 2 [Clostridiales bacterium]|nr:penicillin-binding protein 2 [Clostridiales bacterium]
MASRKKKRRKKPKTAVRFLFRMKKKLSVLFVIIVICLIALIGRLAYIEYTSSGKYEKIVLSNQGYSSTTIPFRRGDITDRKGTVLATSTDVYNLILDCSVLTSNDAYLEPTLDALETCFSEDQLNMSFSEIEDYIDAHPSSQYCKLADGLTPDEIAGFEEMESGKTEVDEETGETVEVKGDSNINGIWFEKEYTREYPYGSLASALIGYTASGDVGLGGIEDSYNDVLNGTDGRRYGYLNSDSNYEVTVREAIDGETVVSTVDENLQAICEDKIKEFYDALSDETTKKGGAEHIAALMMDPNTGEVLAMANYPNYDYTLSATENLELFYTDEELDEMTQEEQSAAVESLKQNFALTYTYEPGSTAKPFTIACGLDTGTLTEDMTFYCDGGEQIADYYIHCVNRDGHGMETIQQAMENSCNDALMQMSYLIGGDNFSRYQQIFNFGLRTNIDLPGESRTDSLVYSSDQMTKINLATNAFGQNFNVTMIQLASAYSSIVNGGSYYQPHVVKKLLDGDGNTVETIEPTLLKQTVSEETAETVTGYLKGVVDEGSGTTAKVDGYSMTGKTGTAQKYVLDEDGNATSTRAAGKYLVSFICAVPAEEPQVVLYVVVDEPNVADQAHSSYAQNVAREILEEALPYLNIYPDEEQTGINTELDIVGNSGQTIAGE